MPTFAFPEAPPDLTIRLQCRWNAPLPLVLLQIHSFGGKFYARLFSAQERSTSELLRTL